MIRQHDVQVLAEDSEVLAEGTFRVVLTRGRRVLAAIDLPDSALGPLHLVFAVSPQSTTPSTFATGSVFGVLGHTIGHVGRGFEAAAEETFDATSKVATTLARPAFNITRDAASAGAGLVAHLPVVPGSERKKIEAASRIVMRARLGDVNARQFVRAIGEAAKAGEHAAQKAGDALLTGTKVVAHVLDTPLSLLGKVPKVGGVLHSFDPFVKMDHMAGALQRGDFKALKAMIENDAKMAQGIASMIPGLGTGISAAISAGMGVLDGGGAIDIAIETAYGAIPIPPGLREVTDTVLASVLALLHHPRDLTDAALAGARNAIPSGLPRHVFDTLVKLVLHHRPILHVASDLVGTYVQRYAGDIAIPSGISATAHVGAAVNLAHNASSALDFATKQLGAGTRAGMGGPAGAGVSLATKAAAGQVGAALAALGSAAKHIEPVGAVGRAVSLGSGTLDSVAAASESLSAALPGARLLGSPSGLLGAAHSLSPGASSAAHAGVARTEPTEASRQLGTGPSGTAAASNLIGALASRAVPASLDVAAVVSLDHLPPTLQLAAAPVATLGKTS